MRVYKPKRYFWKRKPWSYKKPDAFKKRKYKKPIYKRNPKKTSKNKYLKDCKCYSCNQLGHYANECLKKISGKKILIDSDIEEMIENDDFLPIKQFDNLSSDESLFEILTEFDSSDD